MLGESLLGGYLCVDHHWYNFDIIHKPMSTTSSCSVLEKKQEKHCIYFLSYILNIFNFDSRNCPSVCPSDDGDPFVSWFFLTQRSAVICSSDLQWRSHKKEGDNINIVSKPIYCCCTRDYFLFTFSLSSVLSVFVSFVSMWFAFCFEERKSHWWGSEETHITTSPTFDIEIVYHALIGYSSCW